MTRAFVLAGGGSLGAAQAGMLTELLAAGITPDLIVGTSAGALNGALLAGAPDLAGVARLTEVWTGLRRSTVFPTSPVAAARGLLGRSSSLCSPAGLARVIAEGLSFHLLQDSPVPLVVVATELRDGSEVLIERGPAAAALLASAAIPGVLPPVVIDGRALVDGALSNNAPISAAIERGATEVWVLPGGFACGREGAPTTGALAVALHALTLLVGQRLRHDLSRDHGVPVYLVPPLCPNAVAPHDFGKAATADRTGAHGHQELAGGRPNRPPGPRPTRTAPPWVPGRGRSRVRTELMDPQRTGTMSGAPIRAASAVWSSGWSCDSRSAATRAA